MKKKRIIGVLLLGVIAMASLVWYGCTKEKDSQAEQLGTIYGTVTDYATGEPINNANVKLRPKGETTLTGSDGSYQFNNVENGKYTLSLSKDGYSDLDDDYVINVSNGDNVRRDVQLNSLFISFRVMMDGRETDTLNFGADPSIDNLHFTIENNGTATFNASTSISSVWFYFKGYDGYGSHAIYQTETGKIPPHESVSNTIYINRKNLVMGNNLGYMQISSGNHTKTIVVKAIGLAMPMVSNPILTNVSDYTTCNAKSSVINNGGWNIIDKGFEYMDRSYSDVYKISCGPGEFDFQSQIVTYPNHISRVRAYASNGVYTGYSDWVFPSSVD